MEVLARPKKALSSTHRDTVVPVSGPLPPEVLFHRYFPRLSSPQDRERYRGKLDLDTLPDPDMSKVLKELQDDFNMSFAESREALASLGRPLPVHLDYVDSHVANAIAFDSDGYYFIGLTLPLAPEDTHEFHHAHDVGPGMDILESALYLRSRRRPDGRPVLHPDAVCSVTRIRASPAWACFQGLRPFAR